MLVMIFCAFFAMFSVQTHKIIEEVYYENQQQTCDLTGVGAGHAA